MEKIILTEAIDLVCIAAKSFPEGIKEAFDTLAGRLPTHSGFTAFGISYPNADGSIHYKAAAAVPKTEETEKSGLESFTIPPGVYSSEKIENFMENIPLIGTTFRKLLNNPQLEEFPCIEWYQNNKDVICMVKIRE